MCVCFSRHVLGVLFFRGRQLCSGNLLGEGLWLRPVSGALTNVSQESSLGSTPVPWPGSEPSSCKSEWPVCHLEVLLVFLRARLVALTGGANDHLPSERVRAVTLTEMAHPHSLVK